MGSSWRDDSNARSTSTSLSRRAHLSPDVHISRCTALYKLCFSSGLERVLERSRPWHRSTLFQKEKLCLTVPSLASTMSPILRLETHCYMRMFSPGLTQKKDEKSKKDILIGCLLLKRILTKPKSKMEDVPSEFKMQETHYLYFLLKYFNRFIWNTLGLFSQAGNQGNSTTESYIY